MMARLLTILTFLLCSLANSHAIGSDKGTPSRRAPLVLLDEKTGSYCTAFPISSDGYLMTAAHCVKRCLDENQKSLDLKKEVVCSGYELPEQKTSQISIVANGDLLQKKKIETRFGDFAILKIKTTEPLSCLPLAEAPAQTGENLEVIGYPLPKSSAQKPKLEARFGKLYAGPEESRYYRTRKTSVDREAIAELFAREDGVLFASAHHSLGQSGGPVLNRAGQVIGVVSGFAVTHAGKNVVHEMVAGSTERILATLPSDLSRQLVKKSRDCATQL